MLGKAFHVVGIDVLPSGCRVATVAPHHKIAPARQVISMPCCPSRSSCRATGSDGCCALEIVEDRLDVMEVERALAVLFDIGLVSGILPQGPGLVAAEVEMLHVGHERQNVIDHRLNQVA